MPALGRILRRAPYFNQLLWALLCSSVVRSVLLLLSRRVSSCSVRIGPCAPYLSQRCGRQEHREARFLHAHALNVGLKELPQGVPDVHRRGCESSSTGARRSRAGSLEARWGSIAFVRTSQDVESGDLCRGFRSSSAGVTQQEQAGPTHLGIVLDQLGLLDDLDIPLTAIGLLGDRDADQLGRLVLGIGHGVCLSPRLRTVSWRS